MGVGCDILCKSGSTYSDGPIYRCISRRCYSVRLLVLWWNCTSSSFLLINQDKGRYLFFETSKLSCRFAWSGNSSTGTWKHRKCRDRSSTELSYRRLVGLDAVLGQKNLGFEVEAAKACKGSIDDDEIVLFARCAMFVPMPPMPPMSSTLSMSMTMAPMTVIMTAALGMIVAVCFLLVGEVGLTLELRVGWEFAVVELAQFGEILSVLIFLHHWNWINY